MPAISWRLTRNHVGKVRGRQRLEPKAVITDKPVRLHMPTDQLGLLDNTGRSAAYLDSDADIGHGELIAEHEGLPREVSVQDLKGFLQTKSSRIRARSEGRQSHSPRTTQRGTAASISSAGGVPVLLNDGA